MSFNKLLEIIEHQDPRWLTFIETLSDAVIFHHSVWINVLAQTYHYTPHIFAHCDQRGEILTGPPMNEIKTILTGHRWVYLPFSDCCKPLAINETALLEFTERLISLSPQPNMPRIELRWHSPSQQARQELHLNLNRKLILFPRNPARIEKRFSLVQDALSILHQTDPSIRVIPIHGQRRELVANI